jgi:hypothetical protein
MRPKMTDTETTALPLPTFAGGTKAITATPVVGAPKREYTEARASPGCCRLADSVAS